MNPPIYDAIYLSPHLDDVVLSCSGRIHSQTQAGQRVLVITVFAGIPERYGITAFTRELEARWGGDEDAVAVRRREDVAALRVLNAEGLQFDWPDCVYRCDPTNGDAYYATEESIFGEIHAAEANWHRLLMTTLDPYLKEAPSTTLYAPLGVGHHVDHLLTRRAAMNLDRRGLQVLYYEDYPYAGDQQAIAKAQSPWDVACWHPKRVWIDQHALQAKIEAIACHQSQISTFWPNLDAMAEAVSEQALRVGQGQPCESCWRLDERCLGPTDTEMRKPT